MSAPNTPAKPIKKISLSKVEREKLSKDIAPLLLQACIQSSQSRIETLIKKDLAGKLKKPTERDDIRKIGSGSRDSFFGGHEPNDGHREAAMQIVQAVSEIYERPMGPDGAFADDWNSLVGYFSRMLADRCGIKWFGRLVKEIDESPKDEIAEPEPSEDEIPEPDLFGDEDETGEDDSGEEPEIEIPEDIDKEMDEAYREQKKYELEMEIVVAERAENERAAKVARDWENAEA